MDQCGLIMYQFTTVYVISVLTICIRPSTFPSDLERTTNSLSLHLTSLALVLLERMD